MLPFNPERVWQNAREASTEDLLDRVTVYRAGMEPEALEIIEEERVLGDMLSSLKLDEGISIVIGRESGVDQLSSCSLVHTTYIAGPDRVGTLGILGPTRMRYDEVAPRVRFVAVKIGEALNRVLDYR